MKRLLLLLAAALAAPAQAQYTPDPPGPKARRAERERAVALLGGGEVARRFVEDHGDNAVKALAACSTDCGRKLAAWHADPDGLNRLPRPGEFLLVVADRRRGGDELVFWALAHSQELRDLDAFEATLREPMELALSLKPLAQAASENRARRLANAANPGTDWVAEASARPGLLAVGGAAALVFVVWLFRRRKQPVVEHDPLPDLPRTR